MLALGKEDFADGNPARGPFLSPEVLGTLSAHYRDLLESAARVEIDDELRTMLLSLAAATRGSRPWGRYPSSSYLSETA